MQEQKRACFNSNYRLGELQQLSTNAKISFFIIKFICTGTGEALQLILTFTPSGLVLLFVQQEALLTAAGWLRGNWNSTEELLLSFG